MSKKTQFEESLEFPRLIIQSRTPEASRLRRSVRAIQLAPVWVPALCAAIMAAALAELFAEPSKTCYIGCPHQKLSNR